MDIKPKCIKQARDRAKQVSRQLLTGKKTINQIRSEYGLDPIEDNMANEYMVNNVLESKKQLLLTMGVGGG